MRLESIQVRNFRGIEDIIVHFDSSLTVVVGENGAGKTSLLDATSLGLFGLRSFWPENSQRTHHAPTIETSDIAISQSALSISLHVSYGMVQSERASFQIELGSDRKFNTNTIGRLSRIGLAQWEKSPVAQPLFVYYRQTRGFDARNYRPHRKDMSSILSVKGLREQSLSEDLQAIPDLSLWWDNLDAQEARHCRDIDSSYRDPQLEAVRKLVQEMDEFESINFRAKTMRPGLYIKKRDGPNLHVEQLSSGERVYLILLADLARRLQIIEPDAQLKDIPGIILIDEIELNLHPNWQRRITSTLTRIFKSCQFIVSTHSPQVLGQVKNGNILALARGEDGTVKTRESMQTYGRDSNDILIDVFRATERDRAIKSELEILEDMINRNEMEAARQIISKLKSEIGSGHVELVIAEQRLRRRVARSTE